MEQNNSEQTKTNEKKGNEKQPLSAAELQKRKKMIIFPVMFIAFGICLWLIFAPSDDGNNQAGLSGFNSEIPIPEQDNIIGDKIAAYEDEQMRLKQEEKKRSLQDFALIVGEERMKEETVPSLTEPDYQPAQRETSYYGRSSGYGNSSSNIQSSAYAYRDINRTLGNFYNQPEEDKEKEDLKKQVEELTSRLNERERENSQEEQIALLEKSYQLAAKYMGNGQGQEIAQVPVKNKNSSKESALPVKAINDRVVSTLDQPMTDADFLEQISKPRNFSFNTAVGSGLSIGKNTIKACVNEDQSITDGQNVKMRLLEPLQAGHIVLPANSPVTGTARISGERLDINITSLEYQGNIIPVELLVYDSDGQKGLFIPSSLERQAINEGLANIGSGLGSSFTVNQNAGAAIVTDLTRGVLQGGSQYLSRKFRTIKVNLKADYKIMLLPKE